MFTTFSASYSPTPPVVRVRACDQCRRLKIKCQPVSSESKLERQAASRCRQCLGAHSRCTYDETPAKRGRPRKQPIRSPTIRADNRHSDIGHDSSVGVTIENPETEDSICSIATPLNRDVQPRGSEDSALLLGASDDGLISCDATTLPILEPPADMFLSQMGAEQDIWEDIHEFFDTLYIVFPIVSYETLTLRLITEPDWTAVPDFRSLLLAIRLLNAAGRYRMGSRDEVNLYSLIRQVEASRLDHDFAGTASLDDIVCSLCLFTAYNVSERHNRAFLYLDEAITLFNMSSYCEGNEQNRRLRIEQVLYNTEAATHAIYAPPSRKLRATKPIIDPLLEISGLERNADSDRIANHLLKCLTQINLARDAQGLEDLDRRSEEDIETLFGTGIKQHRYSRIQAADVVITRQWRLSSRLVEDRTDGSGMALLPESSLAERLGVPVMSWICLLRDGELRVVGLGKVAALIRNICMLAGRTTSRYVLAGLTSALAREDHNRTYAEPIDQIVTLMTSPLRSYQPQHSIVIEDVSTPYDDPEDERRSHNLLIPPTRLEDEESVLHPDGTGELGDIYRTNFNWTVDSF